MKKFILLVLLLVIGLVVASTAQVSMPCGPGVILRADGSIIIDSYTIYPVPSSPAPAPFNPQMPQNQTKEGPTAITLGKTLADSTKICFEEANGSSCVPLKAVRALK